MAVPADFSILDLSGKFTMNKTLSGDTDTILMHQGIGWLKRKAIAVGTVRVWTATRLPKDSGALMAAIPFFGNWCPSKFQYLKILVAVHTLTLSIKHYKDDEGVEHVDIDQTLTGGIPGTREERTLWWKERSTEDSLFGFIIGKSRRCQVSELDEEFLKKDWTADTIEHGVIQSYVVSDTPKSKTTWVANQAWGIQEINGERRYARNVKFTGPKGEDIEALLVYDYVGTL